MSVFKQSILKFIQLGPSKFFNIYKPHGLKILKRFRLDLGYLRVHKFKHSFSDCSIYVLYVEKMSNLQTISSTNVPYFVKKDKST